MLANTCATGLTSHPAYINAGGADYGCRFDSGCGIYRCWCANNNKQCDMGLRYALQWILVILVRTVEVR